MNTTLRAASCLCVFVVNSLWTTPIVRADSDIPRWEAADCPAPMPTNVAVDCGYLVVPEDHAQPDGPTIRVAVAILRSPSPAPDPLVFLNGGPGGHTLKSLSRLAVIFEPFLVNRDVILFDQRGVGFSQPALDCPELDRVTADDTTQQLTFDESVTQITTALADCRARLESKGVHLAAYTSAQSAADLDALRTVLGYAKWNLFGASYGTRYALTVMRDFPAGLRSVILASVYPPHVNLYDAAPNADRAFNTLFATCAADFACNLAYPNLKIIFYELVAELNAEPITLEVETSSGEHRRREINGDLLMDAVFNLLYSAESAALLPALIYDLHDSAYTTPRQLLAKGASESLAPSFSAGLAFSVQCSEEVPFTSRAELLAASAPHPEPIRRYIHQRLLFTDLAPDLCQFWFVAQPDPIENEPVQSDIPVLVLAGSLDPVTPPEWGRETASHLSHSYFYEFPGLGHTLDGVCPTGIKLGFLNNPRREPDSSCIGRMDARPAFVLRAELTHPLILITIPLLSLITIGYSVAAVRAVLPRRQFSWRMSMRLAGWIPVAAGGAIMTLFLITTKAENESAPVLALARVVETIVPLAAAVHAALIFSPDDEPALETTLATPRPLAWTLLERLALVILLDGGIALAGSAIAARLSNESLTVAAARWIGPLLFLAGAATCITLITRQSVFSIGLILLLWFGLSWAGDGVIIRWPFLWPIHTYLQPDHAYYGLNRALAALLGLAMIIFAARIVGDEERMLLGRRGSGQNRSPKSQSQHRSPKSPDFG